MSAKTTIGIVIGFLVLAVAYFLLIAQDRFEQSQADDVYTGLELITPGSPEAEVVEIIEEHIRPRRILQFAVDNHVMAVRFPVAQNALMGRIDLDFSNYEIVQIACALRENSELNDHAYEFVLTMLGDTEEEEDVMLDAIGIRLEEETIAEMNCNDTDSIRLDVVADDYSLLYLNREEE